MNVTLLYFDDCPSWQTADQHLRALAEEMGFTIERIEVTSPDEADLLRFRGSPSIHIDGDDLFADRSDAPAPPAIAFREVRPYLRLVKTDTR